MEVLYNNLYIHFIFTTKDRLLIIDEKHRARIEKYIKGKFYWQPSCSAFSVSKKDIDKVCQYIKNQPIHHKNQTFAEEYERFMKFYQRTLLPKK